MRIGRGGKRTGTGPKPKTLEQHRRDGTFRHDRHHHLAVVPRIATSAAPALDVPEIPDWMLDGLQEPGRRYLADQWAERDFGGVEQVLLRQAARALDTSELDPMPSVQRMATRLFAALAAQLRALEE